MIKYQRFCENCRQQLIIECERSQISAKAEELGWQASEWNLDALCDKCSAICRIFSYANGEYNSTLLIQATPDGLEIMDGVCTLDWDWIEAMRLKFNPTAIDSGFDEPLSESEQFDAQWLHNFGDLDPIPIGARAKCGAISKSNRSGEIEPLVGECCQICLALTEKAVSTRWQATEAIRWRRKPNHWGDGSIPVLEQLWQSDTGEQEWREVPGV